MTDANLTPEQDAAVRDLLAEARHDEPMPEDVAARLDRVLAQLAEGDSHLDPAHVVELASRRRHRAATLLVAAAAIVVIGVGLGQVVDRGGADADIAGSASADKAVMDAPAAEAAGKAMPERTPVALDRLVEVRSHRFAPDVRRAGLLAGVRIDALQRSYAAYLDSAAGSAGDKPAGGDQSGATPPQPEQGTDGANLSSAGGTASSEGDGVPVDGALRAASDCAPATYGPGRLIAVLYNGEPAVLAFRRPTGDSRIVDLLACGTAEVLRSVTLPR